MTEKRNKNSFSTIGSSNFEEFVTTEGVIFVDKTLLIEEIITDQKAILITRPRRWGKTLNMSMLHYFFSMPTNEDGSIDEKRRQEKINVFSKLKISLYPEIIEHYCGQYPVIFVSFKENKQSAYEKIEKSVRDLIYKLYKTHLYLLQSSKLNNTDKILFQKFITMDFSDAQLKDSILYLSEMLYKHFGKKVIILMDEYDTPMNGWYEQVLSRDNVDSHLDEQQHHVTDLFRSLFGAALKDNDYLEKAVVTGILRIAKASLFSGLNNLGENSILDNEYAKHFGFTEDELIQLLHEAEMDRDDKALTDLKSWYNGYMIGGITIYNPWSIMNYLKKRELKGYWIGTSDTTLIEHVLMLEHYQKDIQKLIAGGTVSAIADPKMVFRDIKSSEGAFYNLLLFSGYLTAAKVFPGKADTYDCLLIIPNQEVLEIFEKSILQWLSQKSYIEVSEYNVFIDALLKGDIDFFLNTLRRFLDTTISYYSIASNKKEDFYNTFVTFLMMLVPKSRYMIEQERESGGGRPDLLIIPKTTAEYKNALILEFKHTNNEADIKLEAQKAFDQINARCYETKIHSYEGVHKIFKIGLAFCGKKVEAVHNIPPTCVS